MEIYVISNTTIEIRYCDEKTKETILAFKIKAWETGSSTYVYSEEPATLMRFLTMLWYQATDK